jgi:sec-independent protein translocase protein TatC
MSINSEFNKIIKDYGPYLNDIWRRIYYIAVFFIIILIIGLFGSGYLVKYIVIYLNSIGVTLVAVSPFHFLNLAVDIGLFLGLLFSVPFIILNIYKFLQPAISKKESRAFLKVFPTSFFLFLVGFGYGALSLHIGLQMLAKLNDSYGLKNYWDISLLLSQITTTSMLLGIFFQFPIVMLILIRVNILDRSFLIRRRRVAYAIITIIVALLPPTDGLSMLFMTAPFIIMYELVILLSSSIKEKKFIEAQ